MVVKMKKQVNETINLKPGCYCVTLQDPFELEINDQQVIRFPFTVDGIRAKTNPHYFYLFKPVADGDESKVERFLHLSKSIRECFNTKLPFNKSNYKLMKGRKGRVVIGICKNGKMGVIFFMRKPIITLARQALSENVPGFEHE